MTALAAATSAVTVPVAFFAGLVSFLSPCVLPLVPGYLSYVTSLSVSDLVDARGGRRGRMAAGALLFVLGFTAVLVSGGALFGYVGRTLLEHQEVVTRVLGGFTVLMGLSFMGFLPGLAQREFRSHRRPVLGLAGAPLLGAVFAVGWTPCIGPTLAAVQALAWSEASAARGALLMAAYCLGLGLPFVLAALAFRRALGAFGLVKRHYQWVLRTGGGMLVLVGVLLATGVWNDLVYRLQLWSAESTTAESTTADRTGSAPTTSFTENGVTVTLSVSDWKPPRATLTAVFTPEEKGFHLYSTELPATGIEGVGRPTSMDVTGVLRADGKLTAAAEVRTISVPGVGAPVPVYPDGPVTTTLPVRLDGNGDGTVLLGYASCSSEEGCTIPVSDRPVHLRVTDEGPVFGDR